MMPPMMPRECVHALAFMMALIAIYSIVCDIP